MKKLLAVIPLSLAVITAQAGDRQEYKENETVTLTGQVTFRTGYDEENEKITYPALIVKSPISVKYHAGSRIKTMNSGRYVQLKVDTMKKLNTLEKKKNRTITVTCNVGIAENGEDFTPVNCSMFGSRHP